jgi:hypothetical protein
LNVQNQIMAGYSGTALWKKLGYKTEMEAYVENAPENYVSVLALHADITVTWLAKPKKGLPFAHLFVTSLAMLKTKLASYRKQIAPNGVIWISWPKKSAGVPTDVSENLIREVALPLGLVDIKVCAVDDVWSGLKLMIRKEQR